MVFRWLLLFLFVDFVRSAPAIGHREIEEPMFLIAKHVSFKRRFIYFNFSLLPDIFIIQI